MELEDIYENVENNDIEDTTKPRTLNHSQDEGKDQKCRGSRRLVLMTVCLGIICVLLLVSIIAQHISNTAERESLFKSNKNTVQEFNQTINGLQHNYTELMTEKDQLKNSFNSLNQKKLELENELRKLSEQAIGCLVVSNEEKSWSDSRKYCRDRGGDLVIIKSEKKQRCVSSFIKEMVWIGLSDIEKEGNMTWVDNSPLKQGFWEKNEPNDAGGKEDCIELNPGKTVLNNWNDIPCSNMRKCVCEI